MCASLEKKMATRRSPLFVVFLTVFIDLIGFGIVLPLSPFYAEHFGATAFQVGLLQASYSLMQFLFAPLWGRVSDRVGRRPILLMSIFGGCISYAAFAFADALWILFAARIFQGIFGANLSTAQAYIADITTPENRSKGMGLIGAAFGLGFIFGPALGAFFSQMGPSVGTLLGLGTGGAFGIGFPALIASLLCLTNFSLALFNLPESLPPEKRAAIKTRESRWTSFTRMVVRPEAAWLIAVFFISSLAIAMMEATLALFAESRVGYGIRETGTLFAFIGLVMAFTQGYLIRKLLPKWGERKMIVIGPTVTALGLYAIGASVGTIGLGFGCVLLALGSGISNPAIMGGVSLVTDPKEQGAVMGVTQSLASLARIMGPVSGGWLFSYFSPSMPYYAAGIITLIAMIISRMHASKLPEVRGMHVLHH
jgi:MFS transporter, DHA1 family, tetracycline resistance protein